MNLKKLNKQLDAILEKQWVWDPTPEGRPRARNMQTGDLKYDEEAMRLAGPDMDPGERERGAAYGAHEHGEEPGPAAVTARHREEAQEVGPEEPAWDAAQGLEGEESGEDTVHVPELGDIPIGELGDPEVAVEMATWDAYQSGEIDGDTAFDILTNEGGMDPEDAESTIDMMDREMAGEYTPPDPRDEEPRPGDAGIYSNDPAERAVQEGLIDDESEYEEPGSVGSGSETDRILSALGDNPELSEDAILAIAEELESRMVSDNPEWFESDLGDLLYQYGPEHWTDDDVSREAARMTENFFSTQKSGGSKMNLENYVNKMLADLEFAQLPLRDKLLKVYKGPLSVVREQDEDDIRTVPEEEDSFDDVSLAEGDEMDHVGSAGGIEDELWNGYEADLARDDEVDNNPDVDEFDEGGLGEEELGLDERADEADARSEEVDEILDDELLEKPSPRMYHEQVDDQRAEQGQINPYAKGHTAKFAKCLEAVQDEIQGASQSIAKKLVFSKRGETSFGAGYADNLDKATAEHIIAYSILGGEAFEKEYTEKCPACFNLHNQFNSPRMFFDSAARSLKGGVDASLLYEDDYVVFKQIYPIIYETVTGNTLNRGLIP